MTVSAQLLDALHNHYRKPGEDTGEVLLTEVTAPNSRRRCDLLRISTWASRGSGVDVHELKVSRSDWLRELDDPRKAEAWWPFCNRFWVVAPPKMIRPSELPEGWGLMEPPTAANRRRFKVIAKAADKEPKLTVEFITSLLSRSENVHRSQRLRMVGDHRNEVHKARMEGRAEATKHSLDPQTRKRVAFLEALEEAAGAQLDLRSYYWDRLNEISPAQLANALGDYVREHALAQQKAEALEQRADRLRQQLSSTLATLDKEFPEQERGKAA